MHAASDPNSDEAAGGSQAINAAQLSGTNAHSEVHIALQSDRLGTVELHARLTGEQVGATITVEKKEAHAALAVELPSLQKALTEMNLRIEHVSLTHAAPNSTANGAGNSASQQEQQRQPMSQSYRQTPRPEEDFPAMASTGVLEGNGVSMNKAA